MAVTHTNRMGKTYYLHQGTTKTGKPMYFFALRAEGDLAANLPPGYEVYENPNAQVFLRKTRPQIITDEEIAIVKGGMQQYSGLEYFTVDVKKDAIVIYTPDQDAELLADTFELCPSVWKGRSKAAIKRVLSYSPMLQFVPVDKAKRQFQTHRYCFLGSIDDWISIGKVDDLSRLAATYVRHLGEESYYDLY